MSYGHLCRTTPLGLGPVTKWEKGKGCVCWDAKGGGARDRIKQPGMWGGEREEELIGDADLHTPSKGPAERCGGQGMCVLGSHGGRVDPNSKKSTHGV